MLWGTSYKTLEEWKEALKNMDDINAENVQELFKQMGASRRGSIHISEESDILKNVVLEGVEEPPYEGPCFICLWKNWNCVNYKKWWFATYIAHFLMPLVCLIWFLIYYRTMLADSETSLFWWIYYWVMWLTVLVLVFMWGGTRKWQHACYELGTWIEQDFFRFNPITKKHEFHLDDKVAKERRKSITSDIID